MSKFFDPLSATSIKRLAHQTFFVAKWFGLLSSATLEIYLHHNFGRRYLVTVFGAILLYAACASFAPSPYDLSNGFCFGLLALACYHTTCVFRPGRPGRPGHSFSTGEPWPIWRPLGLRQSTLQRYLEPGFCFFISFPISHFDDFLGLWLKAGAVSLFLKEQVERIRLTRRVLDSLDAKHEAQTLNAALKPYQQPAAPAAQRPRRAHLAATPLRRNP